MKLSEILKNVTVPKSQFNKFGKFHYSTRDDMLSVIKPLLSANGLRLNETEEVVCIGNRYYIKSTASIFENGEVIAQSVGFAREPETKKGMDESQLTGTATTYARKTALCGLFSITGDEQDPDQMNSKDSKEELNPKNSKWNSAKEALINGQCTIEQIKSKYELSDTNTTLLCSELEQVDAAR